MVLNVLCFLRNIITFVKVWGIFEAKSADFIMKKWQLIVVQIFLVKEILGTAK